MKVLFSASIVGHFEAFHTPYLQYFREKGFEVHTVASGENTSEYVDQHFDIPFKRSPFSLNNLSCYKALKKIIVDNQYDIIHCHTPVVGVLSRLAARKSRKKGTTVIYTSHGFHFYEGAPRVQGTIFRTIEKILSKYTDHLITINKQDFEAITKHRFRPGAHYMVHGVGTDADRFAIQTKENKAEQRSLLGIHPEAFVLIYAAEYSNRKNQKMLIDVVRILKNKIPRVLLLLPGEGELRQKYSKMIEEYDLQEHVSLMGYRNDMNQLLLAADVAVSSAVQEGLPINIVEAMAVSLPVVATRIRGHEDLVKEEENGYLVELNDVQAMADRVLLLYNDTDVLENIRAKARGMAQPYYLEYAKVETTKIYDTVIKAKG